MINETRASAAATCGECERAEADPDWPVFVACCNGCAARWIMGFPQRMRREAATKVRDTMPAEWPAIRERLDVLIAREVA